MKINLSRLIVIVFLTTIFTNSIWAGTFIDSGFFALTVILLVLFLIFTISYVIINWDE